MLAIWVWQTISMFSDVALTNHFSIPLALQIAPLTVGKFP